MEGLDRCVSWGPVTLSLLQVVCKSSPTCAAGRASAVYSQHCLHLQASPAFPPFRWMSLVGLTQDCMGPKEGTVFPGFSPMIAENIEGGSGDFEVTADHLTTKI